MLAWPSSRVTITCTLSPILSACSCMTDSGSRRLSLDPARVFISAPSDWSAKSRRQNVTWLKPTRSTPISWPVTFLPLNRTVARYDPTCVTSATPSSAA